MVPIEMLAVKQFLELVSNSTQGLAVSTQELQCKDPWPLGLLSFSIKNVKRIE